MLDIYRRNLLLSTSQWHKVITIGCILSVTLYIYFPALFHAPRADHVMLLLEIGETDHWWSLIKKYYSYSRTSVHDGFLFRPLFFVFLLTQISLFGVSNFMAYQAVGILLHIFAVLILWKLLSTIRPGLGAFVVTLFFATLMISQENVIWTNMTPHLLAVSSQSC